MTGPDLRPLVHPDAARFLADPGLVHRLLADHGSPLNVVLPDVVPTNLAAVRAAASGARHRIWFAHKASASSSLVAAAVRAGAGVDVASEGEWASALAAGADPVDLLVTGPKGGRLVRNALTAGAVLNVDNLWELGEIVRNAAAAPRRPRVLLRLNGFGRVSRFGVPPAQWDEALTVLAGHRDAVEFLGPAFHVDSSDVRDRVRAVSGCLVVVELAFRAGLAPSVVDVGGGLRQVLLDDPSGYDDFVTALKRGALGQGPAMGWDGDLFGLRVEAGAVVGTPSVHKYGNRVAGAQTLADLLAAPLAEHGGRSVAAVLADNLLELWLEPGKAVADQAGLTLASVRFVTTAADGNRLVHVDLSRDRLCPADAEVLADPLLVPARDTGAGNGAVFTGFVAGPLCLERDVVCRHRVTLPRAPEPGDVLAFVNTAAYCMDLSAAEGLLHPRPARVALRWRDGHADVSADEPGRDAVLPVEVPVAR